MSERVYTIKRSDVIFGFWILLAFAIGYTVGYLQ